MSVSDERSKLVPAVRPSTNLDMSGQKASPCNAGYTHADSVPAQQSSLAYSNGPLQRPSVASPSQSIAIPAQGGRSGLQRADSDMHAASAEDIFHSISLKGSSTFHNTRRAASGMLAASADDRFHNRSIWGLPPVDNTPRKPLSRRNSMSLDRHSMNAYLVHSSLSRPEAREGEPELTGLLSLAGKSQGGDPGRQQELPRGFRGFLQKALQASEKSRR